GGHEGGGVGGGGWGGNGNGNGNGGVVKAFPLVCVCLPDYWRAIVEGEVGGGEGTRAFDEDGEGDGDGVGVGEGG
ncbi:hypothetical protein LTR28_004398, partial [Elasticomyces elasticus]